MKIVCTASVLIALWSKSVMGSDVFQPMKISYDDLMNESGSSGLSTMMNVLSDVGMISITDMPESFRLAKKDTLAWTHPCAIQSDVTKENIYSDGTRRRTMASHTIPGGIELMNHGNGSACQAFDQASFAFRKEVDRVTRVFSSRLSAGLPEAAPLLETQGGFLFKTVHNVVDNGEHLEHFHSYQGSSVAKGQPDSTIEWHTDQGLFLVFTPGMSTAATSQDTASDLLDETEGFYIELADGTHPQVKLNDQDDLVIMLGDGVNQYVNPSLSGRKLRAVPHALAMPALDQDKARVWYGRMVLPPASAVHPKHGYTFGHLRQLLIEASTSLTKDESVLSLGCSSEYSGFTHARQLETTQCDSSTFYCWHRCLTPEGGVSAASCAANGQELKCMDSAGNLWDDTHNTKWKPGCYGQANSPAPAPAACFSGPTTVQVEGVGSVAMKDLQVGDRVLTTTRSISSKRHQKVYAFGHYAPNAKAQFLQITTEGSATPLEVTADHLVHIYGSKHPVRVESVKVGDSLILQDKPVRVISVGAVTRADGLFAPLTEDGTLQVNEGIKVSNYATPSTSDRDPAFVEFQGHISSGISQHTMTHLLLTPLRMICLGIAPQLCQNNILLNDHGMPAYIAYLLDMATFARNHFSALGQALLMAFFIVLMAPLALVEDLVGSALAPWIIVMAIVLFWRVVEKKKNIKIA